MQYIKHINDTSFSSIAFSFMLITIMIIIPLCNKKARRVIAVLAGISSGHGGGFYGGGSSFGGGSSGGGSSGGGGSSRSF